MIDETSQYDLLMPIICKNEMKAIKIIFFICFKFMLMYNNIPESFQLPADIADN